MKKFFIMLLVSISTFVGYFAVNANELDLFFSNEQKIQVEKEAIVKWLQEKHYKSVSENSAKQIVDVVYAHSALNNLNPLLVLALMEKESGFNPKARSYMGAVGLLQIMPVYHRNKIKGRNPYSKDVNIAVGSEILRDCLIAKKGNTNKALNCYSGGAKYNEKIRKSHEEIRNYVVAHQFASEQPVYANYKFHQPFVYWPVRNKQIEVASSSL